MRVSVTVGECRYPYKMTSGEINQALRHARALAEMKLPMAISRPLAIFTGELLAELWNRDEAEDFERQITGFSGKELREAIAHAQALLLLGPRQQIQDGMVDLMFASIAELEGRRKGRGTTRLARLGN